MAKRKPNGYWTLERLHQEALKYQTKKEFELNNISAYSICIKKKLIDQMCSHMDQTNTKPRYYWNNKQHCQDVALKCLTRDQFRTEYPRAYEQCRLNNWLDNLCNHMELVIKKSGYWNVLVHCKTEALKYNCRTDLYDSNNSAYNAILRNNWQDQCFSHMVLCKSKPEQLILNLIKQQYPNSTTRQFRVNLPTHPHIKRFEIDIYIPELRKGVEFDGDYWHSFENLKKSRPNWSDEDIENYHQIKDDYFKSQDIEIIHIKEKDWKEDSEMELKKIWEFLN